MKRYGPLMAIAILIFIFGIACGCLFAKNNSLDQYRNGPLVSINGVGRNGTIRAMAILPENSEPFQVTLAYIQISPTYIRTRRILIDVISTSRPNYILSRYDGVPFRPGRTYEFWLEFSKTTLDPKFGKVVWSTKHHVETIHY